MGTGTWVRVPVPMTNIPMTNMAVILLGSFLIWRINTSKRATVAQYV